ncbi:MAG: efflux RND transporter permease subunit, partial [Lentisphaeria bacterium]
MTLALTFLLVVVVCYLFLQDWRATLIPSLTIPVSLLGSFALLAVLGFTINTLTLFGLILAIGLVVDDAIVVVENVLRIMEEEGLGHKEATIKAMEQVSGAVIATTLVLLAIFVPIGFISGITGKIYQQFAVTMSVAVLLSTVNALTLSPALCATILNVIKPKKWGPLVWFNGVLNVCRNGYVSVSMWVARRFAVTIAFLLMVCFLAYKFVMVSSTSFLPPEDQGAIFANFQLPEGATLPRTIEVAEQFEEIVKQVPEVESFISIKGVSMAFGEGENVAMVIITLKDWSLRERADQHVNALLASLTAKANTIPNANFLIFTPPPISGLGNAGGLEFNLQATEDQDAAKLSSVANSFQRELNINLAGRTLLYGMTTYTANTPQVYVTVDRSKA